MNYSLAADSRSWWLPSAAAGAIGAAALGAILILPLTGQSSAPVNPAPDAPAASVPTEGNDIGRTCFAQRPQRNTGIDPLPESDCHR